MQVFEFERDRKLECRFRGHYFQLDRDPDDDYSFGNWYMIVKNDAGQTACDGWIDDSSGCTARQAMNEACQGALIDPPKSWPKEVS